MRSTTGSAEQRIPRPVSLARSGCGTCVGRARMAHLRRLVLQHRVAAELAPELRVHVVDLHGGGLLRPAVPPACAPKPYALLIAVARMPELPHPAPPHAAAHSYARGTDPTIEEVSRRGSLRAREGLR
jgi:hypothetical protein